jgi:hypothetical protein
MIPPDYHSDNHKINNEGKETLRILARIIAQAHLKKLELNRPNNQVKRKIIKGKSYETLS